MEHHSISRPALLGAIPLLLCCAVQAQTADRANWMRDRRFGVMTHYLADWIGVAGGAPMTVARWNQLIDHFDVEGLAKQIQSVNAGWYQISIGQNSGYYLSPNAAYDRLTGIQPSKCSRRDLVADLSAALETRGIKLMVYLPAGAPNGDEAAKKALEWQDGPYRNREFQLKWEQVIREWSLRWGKKVAGWWFDGCYWPNTMYRSDPPNFRTLASAARAGNPDAVLAFNPGVVYRSLSLTPEEDFTAGEIDDPERIVIRRSRDGKVDGVQVHILSFLGENWGRGSPRFSTDRAVAYTRKVLDVGGAITWDVPIQATGLIPQAFLDQLVAISREARASNASQ